MIITRTPFRMSFFGGGTDLPEYFSERGGAVLSTTFDKYCYLTVRRLPPFFDYRSEVVYSRIERVKSAREIVHPAVRCAMQMLQLENLRISYDADLPARTGLGTSSAFAVGLLGALYALKGETRTKRQLALDAIHLERELCKERGGWQDQIATSFGGLNRIDFSGNDFSVKRLALSPARMQKLNDSLFLCYTNRSHDSSLIHKKCCSERKNHLEEYDRMRELVDVAEKILTREDADLDDFGKLLHETWELKRRTSQGVTTDEIDKIYALGMRGGALGGKLLGAGGGGFLLFYVRQEDAEKFRLAMGDRLFVPFRFEDEGTKVIYRAEEDGQ